jgi:murein DD-endopeptidase MepM/ murein hydrolase activator NlpD
MNDESFEEKLSVKLNKLNVFALAGGGVIFCFFLAILLITSTPLTEYVPGKATSEVQGEIIMLTIKSDSLLEVLKAQSYYLQNIKNIITGEKLITPEIKEKNDFKNVNMNFERSINDSLLRVVVESNERGVIQTNMKKTNDVPLFFAPINGIITDKFNASSKHFGLDLVAKEKARISAVLDGSVIFSDWTSGTGYVIGIQHKNNYLSIYKHNSVLLKSVGEFVNAGDPIAIIGSSGELSSGPHLHFELWLDGTPTNPEDYILF